MILVDANLLLYAKISSLPQHPAARQWLEEVLNGQQRVGLPWPSLLGFVRVITNQRAVTQPLAPAAAWEEVVRWLENPRVWIPSPTPEHADVVGRLITGQVSRSNLVPDAHLAALAMEHGLTLCSSDSDFARFTGLKWRNPIADRS